MERIKKQTFKHSLYLLQEKHNTPTTPLANHSPNFF